ncbi:MAG: RNA polymerase sigma factor [Bacteroidales bacterium]|nr:RNA polymerase sigma factor [Bacteroidales bacterium]
MKSSEFKMMVMPLSSRLYRLAYRMMGNPEEAEDVVQEVYLKLWKMRSELRQYRNLEALSVRITRNYCLDQLRRRKKNLEVTSHEQNLYNNGPETPDQLMESEEKANMVHNLIETLPEPQRSIVHLRHLEGKDYEEISEMLNMNVNAIRVNISRARKQMREKLEKQYSSWRM